MSRAKSLFGLNTTLLRLLSVSILVASACSGSGREPTQSNPSGTGGSGNTGTGGTPADTPDAATNDVTNPPPTMPKICADGPALLGAGDTFIDDFEAQDMERWYDYKDETVTGVLQSLAAEAPGALSTGRAGHLSGTGFVAWGAGMGVTLGCFDVSAFDGISFWAKGSSGPSNEVVFQVVIPATHSEEFGGDCTTKCFDHFSKTITLSEEWTQHSIPFAELAQAGWGTPAFFEDVIVALNWSTIGPDFDYWVDEIGLFAGEPPAGPVGSGGAGPDDGQ